VQPAITLRKLSKQFVKDKKKFLAVNNVSLEVPQGIVFGLLGPNGAGKTTTISMICTLLRPTSGSVELFGVDTTKNVYAARRQLGLVFQETTLDTELSAYDNLRFQAMLYKLENRERKINEAFKLVGLEKERNTLVKTFSGGMKRRLEIARALLTEPKIILLDEPTLGLDAAARKELWNYIQNLLSKKKITVLLTTHYLEEAERVCSYIALMDNGNIVRQGTPEQLISSVAKDVVIVSVQRGAQELAAKLRKEKVVKEVAVEGKQLHVYLQDADTGLVKILKLLHGAEKIEVKKPTLEDAYLQLTGKRFDEADTVKK